MKIAEPESIKAGEQELINSIMEQLNSEIIESIASGRLVVNNLEFRNGDMIIHENRIVYKMEFETSVGISVLFDREGNLIEETTDVTEDTDIPDDIETIENFENTDIPEDIDAAEVIDDLESFEEAEALGEADADAVESVEASGDTDERMELVLKKTRDFWLEKSRDAMTEIETPDVEATDVETGDEQFQEVMQKNKEFWQDQVANNQAAE